MKTWQARCHAEYGKLHASLVERDGKMAEQIALANAEPNAYRRLDMLLTLRPNTALDGKLDDDLANLVGGRHALEVAILEAFRATGRTYAYGAVKGTAAPEAVIKEGRPRGSLEDERENYCEVAFTSGTKLASPPKQWRTSYLEKGRRAVVRPVDEKRAKQIAAAHAEEYAKNVKLFAPTAEATAMVRPDGGNGSLAEKGKLHRYVLEPKVTSVKRTGDKLVVELAGTSENSVPYNCRRQGWDSLGQPYHACDQRKVLTERVATVTFTGVPETMTISAGDRLEFFGKLTAYGDARLIDTAALSKSRVKTAFEGLHLVK
jgi:hypothetical protein